MNFQQFIYFYNLIYYHLLIISLFDSKLFPARQQFQSHVPSPFAPLPFNLSLSPFLIESPSQTLALGFSGRPSTNQQNKFNLVISLMLGNVATYDILLRFGHQPCNANIRRMMVEFFRGFIGDQIMLLIEIKKR
jgi:hypothetical protein